MESAGTPSARQRLLAAARRVRKRPAARPARMRVPGMGPLYTAGRRDLQVQRTRGRQLEEETRPTRGLPSPLFSGLRGGLRPQGLTREVQRAALVLEVSHYETR